MDIQIDNRLFKIKNSDYTIYQFCAKIGINLPCFCYHERLSIAGNCRICVVEANNAMVVSCGTMLLDNMKIFTKSKRIKKAREGVLEFLLANHPLDCPICDQGGECDLQDILLIYGSARGRYYEINKKAVTNLNNCGPFIKTVMTRCIQCTRCVRFANEISAIYDFGIIGRGSNMEIGTYINNFIHDELLACIIDLCPVGALISMPNSFVGRNWEIKYYQSIDILDSLAVSIKLGVSLNNIKRILPNVEEFYDEWLNNKARFIFDSFNVQRLHYPKLKLCLKFISISWKKALYIFIYLLNNNNKIIQSFIGPYCSLELAYNLKKFFNSIGCNNFFYFELEKPNVDLRYTFLLNNTLKCLHNVNDLLIIGCNVRLESPLLNAIFRKNYIYSTKFKAYLIGLGLNYINYPLINLGSSVVCLYKYLLGLLIVNKYFLFNNYYNLNFFQKKILFSYNFLIGSACLIRNDANVILNNLFLFNNKFLVSNKNLNILSRHLGRISTFELNLNFSINNKNKLKKFNFFNLFLGLDNIYLNLKNKININIYIGSFYLLNFFEFINLILCSCIYVENIFSYLNLEGRFRFTNKVISSGKLVFADYNIINSIHTLSKNYFINNFSIIKNYVKIVNLFKKNLNYYIYDLNKFIKNYNTVNKIQNYIKNYNYNFYNIKYTNSLFSKIIFNFYNSDIFCKYSNTISLMALKINYINFNNNIYS